MPPTSSITGPALWGARLSLPTLATALDQLAATGAIRNLKTRAYGTISPEYLASIQSGITLAVREAHTMGLLPDAASVEDAITAADLRPILGVLPELAHRGATLAGHARPDSAADFVRKALVSIEFLTASGGARDAAACVLPAWQPLYAASQMTGRAVSKKGRASALLALQRLGVLRGVATPQTLPTDRHTLVQWLDEAGFKATSIPVMISCYVHAHKLLPAAEQDAFPIYARVRMSSERHLGMLPDVVARARAAGSSASEVAIRDLPMMDLLKLLAPGVAEDLEDYFAMPRPRALGRDAQRNVINAASRYVAAAIRLSETHATAFATGGARLLYFLEHLVTIGAREAQGARPVSRGLQARSAAIGLVQVPLLQMVLDHEAAAGRKNSPILIANGVDHYPESVRSAMGEMWRVIQHLYGGLSESAPEEWEMLTLRYLRMQDRVQHRRAGAPRGGRSTKPVPINPKNKKLAIRTVTLPQLVCVGLPVLSHHVDALRARYETVREQARRKGHENHLEVRNARRAWHDALTEYVVLALATDDGLRLSNYSYARLGATTEIRPTLAREADGTLVLRSLHTRFTGTGGTQPEARLKMLHRAGTDGERERERRVSPGVVRMDLVLDFLQGPRAENLLFQGLTDRAGASVTPETYSLERELAGEYGKPFAFFVSDSATRADRAYNKNRASEVFGKALHWVARHALGRDVPDLETIDAASEYRAIFAIHISRLLIATYWLGVRTDIGREGINRAMHITDDTERALRDDYDAVDDVIREARRVYVHESGDRWQHPDAYNAYMDRLWSLEVLEWTRLADLPRPAHLGPDLIAPVTRAVTQQRVHLRQSRTPRAA